MLGGLSPAVSLSRCSFWGGRKSVPKHVPFPPPAAIPCPAPRRPPGVRNLSLLLAIQTNPSGEGEARDGVVLREEGKGKMQYSCIGLFVLPCLDPQVLCQGVNAAWSTRAWRGEAGGCWGTGGEAVAGR